MNKTGNTARHKLRGLGRGSIVLGRGGGGSRIHNSISYVRLGRSGDAKTARKAKGYGRTDGPTDRRTDEKRNESSRNQLGRSSNARITPKMRKDGRTQ